MIASEPALGIPASPATPVVALTGDFQFGRGQRIVQSQIQSRMMVWCKAGLGRVICNGQKIALEPKDAVFLPWNRELIYEADARTPFLVGGLHIIPHHDRAEPMRFYVPHAARDLYTNCSFRQDRHLPGLEGILQARFMPADPLELLAEYLVAKFRHASVGATERVSSTQELIDEAYALAPVFLSEAARCFCRTEGRVGGLATPPGVLPSDLVRLLRFIDNHLSDPIGLCELA
ncbi:MAG TPA: hypothetical protein VL860_14215, partial [Planctomycetota bacterium]|nr:hypothetical protein [Planctomycetota bacterium]